MGKPSENIKPCKTYGKPWKTHSAAAASMFFWRFPKGLASLSACQSLCENTMGCKGVEYHISGRCEIWTRPGGIEASIGAPQWF